MKDSFVLLLPVLKGQVQTVPKRITTLLSLRLLVLFCQQTPNLAMDQRELGTGGEEIELWKSGPSIASERAEVQATLDLS